MPSEALVESVGAYFKKESSGVELYQEIVNKFTEYNLNLNNSRSLKEMVLTIFDNTFAITTVVRILIALIVSAGFLASVLQYIYERRSFYQVCQVMGISINRLLYSLYLEIGMLIIPGLACGIALGVALAVILVKLVNPLSFGWSLKLSLTGAAYVTPVILLLACSLLMVPILFIALRQLTKPPYRSLE
jgi:putative ABC transport system permease protein